MRGAPQKIQQLVESVVAGMSYELVGVELHAHGGSALVRIYIDNEKGITVDDCEKISHQVSGVFDVEDPIQGPYTLEVSSPGLDRPLFTATHFERFVGRDVRIRLHVPIQSQRNMRGTINGVSDDVVRLNVEGAEIALNIADIEKANLVPEFK